MIKYRVIRSRRKTAALTITPALEVVVRAPLSMPEEKIRLFVSSHEVWISRQLQRLQAHINAHPEPTAEIWELLRCRAEEYIPQRVDYYSGLMGVRPTGIRFTRAKTRFGSCSGKNALCFSLRLMEYPEEAVDYVIVHELAHIRHKNHGPEFHRFVESILPDHSRRKKLLKL